MILTSFRKSGVFTIMLPDFCGLPSWDKSFFCSSRISDWDITLSLAWFSMWILRVSVEPSKTPSPWPDTNLGWEATAKDRNVVHCRRFKQNSWNTKEFVKLHTGITERYIHPSLSRKVLLFETRSLGRSRWIVLWRLCFIKLLSSNLTGKDALLSSNGGRRGLTKNNKPTRVNKYPSLPLLFHIFIQRYDINASER